MTCIFSNRVEVKHRDPPTSIFGKPFGWVQHASDLARIQVTEQILIYKGCLICLRRTWNVISFLYTACITSVHCKFAYNSVPVIYHQVNILWNFNFYHLSFAILPWNIGISGFYVVYYKGNRDSGSQFFNWKFYLRQGGLSIYGVLKRCTKKVTFRSTLSFGGLISPFDLRVLKSCSKLCNFFH